MVGRPPVSPHGVVVVVVVVIVIPLAVVVAAAAAAAADDDDDETWVCWKKVVGWWASAGCACYPFRSRRLSACPSLGVCSLYLLASGREGRREGS